MNTTDEDLMLAYASGDTHAFDTLYSRYEKRIYSFLVKRLSNEHKTVASDLFQMVWLKLHQSRALFKENKKFSTWIYTIALNQIRDFLRQTKSKKNEIVATYDNIEEFGSDRDNPEVTTLLKEQNTIINDSLKKLSPDYLEAVLLVDVEGFSNSEASEILGLNEQNFRKQLSRARGKLTIILQKEGVLK